jgi:hypothetical protein
MGCGKEIAPSTSKTPGWSIKNKDEIEKDARGFNKISLRRNNKRLLQTSLYCLQAWHANFDISVLLYESDPKHPNAKELANIMDYVIGYACKGNATLNIEKKQVKDFALRYVNIYFKIHMLPYNLI